MQTYVCVCVCVPTLAGTHTNTYMILDLLFSVIMGDKYAHNMVK